MNLEKNGLEIFRIDKEIKKVIINDIKKNIAKKLKLNSNINFKSISNKISELDDKNFSRIFGNVANRYLSYNTTKKINFFLKKNKLNKDFKKVFLHQMSPTDLKLNPELKKKNFCVYYRVVRKNKKDTLFVHRDYDFWKLHNRNRELAPYIPYNYNKRIKVWMPIYGCDKKNSLKFFNYSHLHKIKSKYKKVKGFYKPIISDIYIKKFKKNIVMPLKKFKTDTVIFDDKCVHFAPVNHTTALRISCEFTAMVSK